MSERVRQLFRVLFVPIIVLMIVCAHNLTVSRQTVTLPSEGYLLIDAGHGGEDGGASAADGTLEKTINLAIATDLRDMLTLFGLPIRMTRETDISIHNADCSTTRQMKVSDMQNRLKLYEASSLAISIHQNHFSVAKYDGAQVFYSANQPLSRTVAESVRSRIVSLIQPNNKRELKQATDGIYLLHHSTKPAVLVECGFLSNPQECDKLKQESYRQQMAFAIACGVLDVYHT